MCLNLLFVVTDNEILDHVIMISNFLLPSISLLGRHDLKRRHAAIFVVMNFLIVCDMVGIICDPANVVRMFVQDVDRIVGKIFIDDGRFAERVHDDYHTCSSNFAWFVVNRLFFSGR